MPDFSSFHNPSVPYRQQFPALHNKLYFNYGGQGPLSQVALDAILEGYKIMQLDGPFSKKVQAWIDEGIAQAHQVIANELTVAPDTITLTDSVSTGCNQAIASSSPIANIPVLSQPFES
jgi:L-cysteine/cystine lyase